MKKKLFILLAALLTVHLAIAQTTFEVQAPNVVGVGEAFKVVFTLNQENNKDISDFTPPSFAEFNVHSGPVESYMRGFNSINGKSSSYVQKSFTYILSVDRVGTFTIGQAKVKAGKEYYSTSTLNIEVVKNENAGKPEPGSNSTVTSDDIFLKLTLDKKNVVKGEPIIASLEIYTNVPIARFEDVKFPVFNGFWSQDLYTPQNIDFTRKHYNNRIYDVALLRKYILLPQQSGQLEIDPAALIAQVQIRNQRASNSFFDFFEDTRTVRKRLVTDRMTVNVKDLPANAPASFCGGVGTFSISAEISDEAVNIHDAVSLKLTVSGTGNLNLIEAPKLDLPSDFEVYDPKTEYRTSSASGGTQGSVVFEYPFIPRMPGEYIIGPVEFSYYDIKAGVYKTISLPEFSLSVKGDLNAAGNGNGGLQTSVNRQAVKNIGEDIRFIEARNLNLYKKDSLFAGSLTYWILIAVILLVTAVLYKAFGMIIKSRNDVVSRRSRRAMKVASARLKHAHTYEELHVAIIGYIADKLHMPSSELSKSNIGERLLEAGVDAADVEKLIALLDVCEFARYSPSSSVEEMSAHHSEAVDVLSNIEDRI